MTIDNPNIKLPRPERNPEIKKLVKAVSDLTGQLLDLEYEDALTVIDLIKHNFQVLTGETV